MMQSRAVVITGKYAVRASPKGKRNGNITPGMCAPCGLLSLLSLTMCFILRSCGMMDFYYWLPYAFHRIAVLGFIVQLSFNVT